MSKNGGKVSRYSGEVRCAECGGKLLRSGPGYVHVTAWKKGRKEPHQARPIPAQRRGSR